MTILHCQNCTAWCEFQWHLVPETQQSQYYNHMSAACNVQMELENPETTVFVTLYGCEWAKGRTIQSFGPCMQASTIVILSHPYSVVAMYPCEQAMG